MLTFTEVKEIPKSKSRSNIRACIEGFMSQNIKYAKVNAPKGQYKHVWSAARAINVRAKLDGLPVKAKTVDKEVYIIRTDI